MYASASLREARSFPVVSFPPAACSCPPPLKYLAAQSFAETPFFERMDTLNMSSSWVRNMLMRTSATDNGMFTKPSLSPLLKSNLSWVSLSRMMKATPHGVIVSFSLIRNPMSLRRFSL